MSAKANKFWDRMVEIYGFKWVNSYGSKPTELWIDTLEVLPNFRIRYAINNLLNSGESYVPTLPQVRGIALKAPLPADYSKAAIGHEAKEWTAEEKKANREKLGRLAKQAMSGKYRGMSEAQIAEELAGGEK